MDVEVDTRVRLGGLWVACVSLLDRLEAASGLSHGLLCDFHRSAYILFRVERGGACFDERARQIADIFHGPGQ